MPITVDSLITLHYQNKSVHSEICMKSEEKRMARLAGLEPTTSSSAGTRSIQLSYKRIE